MTNAPKNETRDDGDDTSPSAVAALTDGLTGRPEDWTSASLLSVTQITPDGLNLLFRVAADMRELVRSRGGDDRLRHRVLATVFYEASTRTSCSFQAAMTRLGGGVVHVDGGGNSSANKKGETLRDTIRCLACYADAVVLRHPVVGSVRSVHDADGGTPVVNAGDGSGEHPTQALLDLFTIRDELGLLEKTTTTGDDDEQQQQPQQPIVVVLSGDLKHGRTVHSLAKLLARSGSKVSLRYCSPPSLAMPDPVKKYVARYGLEQTDHDDLREAVKGARVLYMTRIQKERFESSTDYDEVAKRSRTHHTVDATLMRDHAPENMVVLHPLPRTGEITEEVDADPRAAYFRQMENGMYVRMALLALLLGKAGGTE